jgi:hypothetical protein
MSAFLGVLALLLILAALLAAFMRLDAARLASAFRLAGPAVLGLAGMGLLVVGRAALGAMLVSIATAWYGAGRARQSARKTPGKRSTVRTAALEMELDHDSGTLNGMVLAGRHEQRSLGSMRLEELLDLRADLAADAESLQLLETYLDSHFPVWRQNAQPNDGDRHRAAPGSGAMTKEEAYKVLGLEAGATATDIRQAHRRLMQRLHPDLGGSSFLAARINEAKDVLLSNHG